MSNTVIAVGVAYSLLLVILGVCIGFAWAVVHARMEDIKARREESRRQVSERVQSLDLFQRKGCRRHG